jgi:NAD(P)-dependent dehydrogenase (short-subunit alcohol dehydrogenase family)
MRGLRDKRVLISGGSSGIGKATAQRFLEEGARVFLCGLDPDEVDAAIAELREFGVASGIPADVSREDNVTRLVDSACGALGGIDVLINNAGIAWREPFLRITPSHWDRMITVNLRGMFLVAQAVARVLVDQGGGGSS